MNHCHFCGNNIPDEVDTCAQANYACDGPRTKESNTPDTEEDKNLCKELRMVSNMINMGEKIQWARETTLMDKAAERIESLSSRDTYWKERVEDERKRCIKVVEDYGERMEKHQSRMIGTAHDDCKEMLSFDLHSRRIAITHILKALGITNEDNLK